MKTPTPPSDTDFRQYRLNRISDLDIFIRYDRDRYLIFLRQLNDRLDSLPIGSTLKARDYVKPKQYNLFTKLCCLHCTLSRMSGNNSRPYIYDMLPDYSGIKKVAR